MVVHIASQFIKMTEKAKKKNNFVATLSAVSISIEYDSVDVNQINGRKKLLTSSLMLCVGFSDWMIFQSFIYFQHPKI